MKRKFNVIAALVAAFVMVPGLALGNDQEPGRHPYQEPQPVQGQGQQGQGHYEYEEPKPVNPGQVGGTPPATQTGVGPDPVWVEEQRKILQDQLKFREGEYQEVRKKLEDAEAELAELRRTRSSEVELAKCHQEVRDLGRKARTHQAAYKAVHPTYYALNTYRRLQLSGSTAFRLNWGDRKGDVVTFDDFHHAVVVTRDALSALKREVEEMKRNGPQGPTQQQEPPEPAQQPRPQQPAFDPEVLKAWEEPVKRLEKALVAVLIAQGKHDIAIQALFAHNPEAKKLADELWEKNKDEVVRLAKEGKVFEMKPLPAVVKDEPAEDPPPPNLEPKVKTVPYETIGFQIFLGVLLVGAVLAIWKIAAIGWRILFALVAVAILIWLLVLLF